VQRDAAPAPRLTASSPPGFVPPPLPRPAAASTANDNSTTSTTTVEIGTIIINGAKDANGVAKDIRRAVNDSMVTQANRGLQ
jgi:hypothetical protein